MQEFEIKSLNQCIRYHDFPGKGTPILFIHGLGCAGSFDYPEVAAQEELRDSRRIVVDLLGSGFSDKPEDFNYSVSEHAGYLLEFIEYLQLDKIIIYGHSLGGAVALSLANRCRSKVHKIILSEANLDSGGGMTSKAIASYKMDEFINRGHKSIVLRSKKTSDRMWGASFSVTLPKAAYLISQSAIEGEEPSWREILYSLECSRTFIFGENSLPDSDVQVLAEHGINIEIVKKAGHSMAWDNPKGLACAIKNGIIRD